MKNRHKQKINTPTNAVEMFNMAQEIVSIMTCPLGDRHQQIRYTKLVDTLDQLPKAYAELLYTYINRKIDEYHEPNEYGFSASDMDQAILRVSGV
jgi:hypothetical protein